MPNSQSRRGANGPRVRFLRRSEMCGRQSQPLVVSIRMLGDETQPGGPQLFRIIEEFMHKPVRKAVFPVAGLGTRFLPATKAMPKEMLPIVDKPLIHYAVEEAKAAGIEEFFFVTSRGKSAIDDHFDRAFELEATLRERSKEDVLAELEARLPEPGQIAYTRQQTPLGLGHAVWCARELVGDEPFA